MSLHLQARMTIREDDPLLDTVRRNLRIGERTGHALKRSLSRYASMIENTPPPPGEIVSGLYAVLSSGGHGNLLHLFGYPAREKVEEAIRDAAVPSEVRGKLLSYLDRCTYAEYSRLIESVESMA